MLGATLLPGESSTYTGGYNLFVNGVYQGGPDTCPDNPGGQCAPTYNLPGSPAGYSGPSTPVPFVGGGASGPGGMFDSSPVGIPIPTPTRVADNATPPAPIYAPTASQPAPIVTVAPTTTNSGIPLPAASDLLANLEQPTSFLGLNMLEIVGIGIVGIILLKSLSGGGSGRGGRY